MKTVKIKCDECGSEIPPDKILSAAGSIASGRRKVRRGGRKDHKLVCQGVGCARCEASAIEKKSRAKRRAKQKQERESK